MSTIQSTRINMLKRPVKPQIPDRLQGDMEPTSIIYGASVAHPHVILSAAAREEGPDPALETEEQLLASNEGISVEDVDEEQNDDDDIDEDDEDEDDDDLDLDDDDDDVDEDDEDPDEDDEDDEDEDEDEEDEED